MNIEEMLKNQIFEHLVNTGCNESVARKAALEGIKFFHQGNHKDPFFDCCNHAGLVHAQNLDTKYKYKKPSRVDGRPFTYTKPKTRKHNKSQQAMF